MVRSPCSQEILASRTTHSRGAATGWSPSSGPRLQDGPGPARQAGQSSDAARAPGRRGRVHSDGSWAAVMVARHLLTTLGRQGLGDRWPTGHGQRGTGGRGRLRPGFGQRSPWSLTLQQVGHEHRSKGSHQTPPSRGGAWVEHGQLGEGSLGGPERAGRGRGGGVGRLPPMQMSTAVAKAGAWRDQQGGRSGGALFLLPEAHGASLEPMPLPLLT